MRASAVGERAGIPSVGIVVTSFVPSARGTARGQGMPDVALAVYPGAIDTHSKAEMERNLEKVVEEIIEGLTNPLKNASGQHASKTPSRHSGSTVFQGTFEEVNEFFYREEWTDGLPIVPPTRRKVEQFLKQTDRSPDEEVAILLLANQRATPWTIAVNGVMAGCKPEHMPILIAATEALGEPKFKLKDIGTTAGLRPYFLINGPIIKQLGLSHGTGLITPAPTPNSSIGRAMHLIVRNIAGFKPGTSEMGMFGLPQSFVLAEDEESNPWEPYHVEHGFDRDTSAVTAMAYFAGSQQFTLVTEDPVRNIEGLLFEIKKLNAHWSYIFGPHSAMFTLLLGPSSARVMAKGFTKQEVKEYLVRNGTVTKAQMINAMDHYFLNPGTRPLPPRWDEKKPEDRIPIIAGPDMIHIVVCGNRTRNRNMILSAGYTNPVIKKIQLPARWDPLLKGPAS